MNQFKPHRPIGILTALVLANPTITSANNFEGYVSAFGQNASTNYGDNSNSYSAATLGNLATLSSGSVANGPTTSYSNNTSTYDSSAGYLVLNTHSDSGVLGSQPFVACCGTTAAVGGTSASGTLNDVFTLLSPTLAIGTQVSMTVSFDLSGLLTTSGSSPNNPKTSDGNGWSANSYWDLVVQTYTVYSPGEYFTWTGSTGNSASGNLTGIEHQNTNGPAFNGWAITPFGLYSETITGVIGNSYALHVVANAGTSANVAADFNRGGDQSASASADFTFNWGGIALHDSNGNLISNFTAISSATNQNYANPIPLPGSIWLFASTLAGLLGLGRRKTAR